MSDKTQRLLILTHNFDFSAGKWMGPNFLLSLLHSPSFQGSGVEFYVVSRGKESMFRQQGNIRLRKVASSSISTEPFDRYGLLWGGQARLSLFQDFWARLQDSAKVAKVALRLLPERQTVWWTEPYFPLGSLVRAYGALRQVKNVLILFNYQRIYPLHDTLLRASLEGFDSIVTTCHALEERLAHLGIPRERLMTIRLGVDVEQFTPVTPEEKATLRRSYGVDVGARVVVWFGPIIPPSQVEDVRFLLEAIPAIRRRAGDTTFIFAFKYGVPPNLRSLDPGIMLLDRYGDLRDILHMADVVALPFTATHAWITAPLSMVEALACGVPVVTLRRPGLTEVVADGQSGLLVESLAEFSQAVGELCVDESRRAHLAIGARRWAELRADVRAIAQQYIRLL
jgi:glycosyltransferase involved in cell wall biosynthesis